MERQIWEENYKKEKVTNSSLSLSATCTFPQLTLILLLQNEKMKKK